jgi:hypothetical protein
MCVRKKPFAIALALAERELEPKPKHVAGLVWSGSESLHLVVIPDLLPF